MATSNKPVFAQGGRTVNAIVTAAKTTYGDSVNAVKLCDAGPNGSMLKGLSAMMRATLTTASQLTLYRSPDDGLTLFIVDSVQMAGHTVAATTKTPKTYFERPTEATPLYLGPDDSLWVSSGTALAGGIVFTGDVEDL